MFKWSVDLDDENEIQLNVSGVATAFIEKVFSLAKIYLILKHFCLTGCRK